MNEIKNGMKLLKEIKKTIISDKNYKINNWTLSSIARAEMDNDIIEMKRLLIETIKSI